MVSRLDKLLLLLDSMNSHLSAHGNAFVKSPSWHRSSPSGFGAVQKEVCPTCKGARRTVHATEPCHKCLIGDESQVHGCGHCLQCFDAKKKRSRGFVFVDPYDSERKPVLSEPDVHGAQGEPATGVTLKPTETRVGSESIRQLDKADFPALLYEGEVQVPDSGTQSSERGLTGSEADGKPQETAKQLARSRRVDKEIALLLSKPVGPEVWERERAVRDRRGSYRELERALEALRMESPLHSSLILRVYVNHDVELDKVDAMGQWHLHYALTWLSDFMPAEIRCPQELLDRTVAVDRVATVTELHAQGMSPPKIAKQLGMQLIKVKKALKRAA